MTEFNIADWPLVATSGSPTTLLNENKHREQKLSVHRHADGREMVIGIVTVRGVTEAEDREECGSAGAPAAIVAVASRLNIDGFTVDSCLRSLSPALKVFASNN
jgi:hypothetical protein